MSPPLQTAYLARHGETAWSRSGRHTGRTDVPLTADGDAEARRLGERLRPLDIARVLTSPLRRAARTCELAGFGANAEVDADLVEWDYGDYEGLRSADIRRERPGWQLFRDGCPGGESASDVAVRADRVIARVREGADSVLVFSSGHLLRVLGARWLGLPATAGQYFLLATASLSALGYEHDGAEPVLRFWNDTGAPGRAS